MDKRHPSPLSVIMTILAAILITAALVYFTGVVFFQNHFPFQTSFLGYDISQQEVSAIDECMDAESRSRTLTLVELDGSSETISLTDQIGYKRTVTEPDGGWIGERDPWLWPLSLRQPTDLSRDAQISYDEVMLEETVDSLSAMDPENTIAPTDAYLEWQEDVLVMIPENDGNVLDRDRVIALVKGAVEADANLADLEANGCYLKAEIRSDDPELNRILNRYAAINFQTISLDMTGETIELSPDDVLGFYIEEPETGSLTLDTDAVNSFVAGLKEGYDTYEKQRPFVDHYGDEITVGTYADTYGFRLDADATTELLSATLESHERHSDIQPVWTDQAWARDQNGCDIGATYIEISIRDQRLWAYQNGEEILSTDVVTGNSGNHDTPRGVFRILYMSRDTYLEGDDYRNHVDYWMPLTWSGIGLHDADWRSSFGGSIYTYSGSHGCINMPDWAASSLFNSYSSGTPVVIW